VDHRSVEQLPLRELFTGTEMLIRELTEHLQQSFLPRMKAIVELVESHGNARERDEIADSTVRTRMAALLASDDFTQQLFARLERHLSAISTGAQQAVHQH
jgi:hypothetical protein